MLRPPADHVVPEPSPDSDSPAGGVFSRPLPGSSFKHCRGVGVAAALLGVVIAFHVARFSGYSLGPPLDDALIHGAFAKHLANDGLWGLFFGTRSGGETSLFWPLLLVPAEFFGMGAGPRWSLLLGAASLALLAGLVGGLASTPQRGRVTATATGLSGPLLFLGLSGMENLPALTLGMAALYRFSRGDAKGAVWWAGSACLLRPEAALLLPALWLGIVDSHRVPGMSRWRIVADALWVLLPGLALAVIALLGLVVANGHFPPSTLAGRRWIVGLDPAVSPWQLGAGSAEFLSDWARAIVADFGMGRVLHGRPFFGSEFLRWMWKVSLLLCVAVGFAGWLRRSNGVRLHAAPRLLFVWTVWVVLLFALILPHRGHVGRYQPQVYVLLLLLAVEGAATLVTQRSRINMAGVVASALLAAGLLGSWVEATVLWSKAVGHLERVHLTAAVQLPAHLGIGDLDELRAHPAVAVFDVGAMAYVYEGQMVDMSGLSDPASARALATADEGGMARLLLERRASHVVLPVFADDGPGSLRYELGLTEQFGIRLEALHDWQSPVSEWGRAFAFSGNAFRRLRLYRVHDARVVER